MKMGSMTVTSQEELEDILRKLDTLGIEDEDRVICLSGEYFVIPANIGGIIHKGLGNPEVEFDSDVIESGIDLQDVEFDIRVYINGGNYEMFIKAFDNNTLLGIKLLRQAAEAGDGNAQFALGLCYIEGYGVKKDRKEAIKWLQRVVRQKTQRASEAAELINSLRKKALP